MKSSITKDGETSIPIDIRRRHRLQEGDDLVWLDDGETIRVIPVPLDPVTALRGSAKSGSLLDRLLAERREERERSG